MFKVFFLFEKRRWDLVGCSWKNVERWSPNHRGRVSSDSSPWPEIETALESKVQNIEKLQMQSSVIVVIGVSNSLVYMTSSPKPQLFKSERCETQSHIVHWLSSSIFTCLFGCPSPWWHLYSSPPCDVLDQTKRWWTWTWWTWTWWTPTWWTQWIFSRGVYFSGVNIF